MLDPHRCLGERTLRSSLAGCVNHEIASRADRTRRACCSLRSPRLLRPTVPCGSTLHSSASRPGSVTENRRAGYPPRSGVDASTRQVRTSRGGGIGEERLAGTSRVRGRPKTNGCFLGTFDNPQSQMEGSSWRDRPRRHKRNEDANFPSKKNARPNKNGAR